jgi:hypothetical protein
MHIQDFVQRRHDWKMATFLWVRDCHTYWTLNQRDGTYP